MSDFCKQCAEKIFGDGTPSDFIVNRRGTLGEGEGWRFLCEGCGPTIVDDDGVCLSQFCLQKHRSKP